MASIRAGLLRWGLRLFVRSKWQEDLDINHIRRAVGRVDSLFKHTPRGVDVTDIDAGGVPCQWITPHSGETNRVLYYIHGGAFSIHMPRTYAHFAAAMGRLLHARVLLVDYRLAPEHPFPAAPQDCLSVYRWLLQQPGVEPGRVVIAGDSAGGNLTLVTMLMAKEAGVPLPAAAWAISPGVNCNFFDEGVLHPDDVDPMFTHQALHMMSDYFGDADRNDWRLSPVFGDLAGLPPILIGAGEREMLRNQPGLFAVPARAAGVEVQDKIWRGMVHVFQIFPFLPEARLARNQAAKFLASQMWH
jgi:acetyl esterase/lipase